MLDGRMNVSLRYWVARPFMHLNIFVNESYRTNQIAWNTKITEQGRIQDIEKEEVGHWNWYSGAILKLRPSEMRFPAFFEFLKQKLCSLNTMSG